MRLEDLAGWFPVDITWEANSPVVAWRFLGDAPFVEPFFAQTVARSAVNGREPLRTPLDVLEKLGEEPGGVGPTGFLFHMSRCGSTLASRLLSASASHLVLSEPDAINKLLGAPAAVPGPLKARYLRGLVRALDQRGPRSQRHFFIKFSSWNVTELGLIRTAFPEVPRCFLFRDPVEVMVSLLDDPPGWLSAAMAFERSSRGPRSSSPEASCARLLAHFCRSALELAGPADLFLDYRSLPASAWSTLAGHFGVSFNPAEIGRMGGLAGIDAKDVQGSRAFAGDGAAKRARASPLVREMAATWLEELHRRLLRRASGADDPITS